MSTNTLGRYQIIREIGRSNDIVYEAVDPSINRRVALKELLVPPNLSGQQRRERVERFYREARAAGSLAHPNIVTIYEAGEDQGRHFIAMEYLEGQTLRDVLSIEGNLSVDRAVEIARQVCSGLAYAHSRGVIHRDIKPDNVQILPGGHVKITDFGIARLMEEPTITADGQVFGTPSYMSPEQVAGRPLDARTDLFSLGVMLFEMLTGKKPFTGDTVVTITYNIMNQEVMIPPTVPPYLERVIRKALSKEPHQRYATAEEMAADMDAKSFNGFGYPSQPDPFGSTMSAPGPLYGPQAQYPGQPPYGAQTPLPGQIPFPNQQPFPQTPPPPVGDPFGGLQPDDLRLPKLPRGPSISAEAKYFLKVMTTVVLICGVLIGFVWMFSSAYRGYQHQGSQQQISMHLENGKRYFENQSYNAAIEEFNRVLKVAHDPKLAKITRRNIAACYLQLGIQNEKAGRTYDAIGQYKQAIVYDEKYAEAYLYLGNALERIGQRNAAFAAWRDAQDAAPGSQAATVASENTAGLYVKMGDQEYQNGRGDAAVEYWRKAMETAPGTKPAMLAQERVEQFAGFRSE